MAVYTGREQAIRRFLNCDLQEGDLETIGELLQEILDLKIYDDPKEALLSSFSEQLFAVVQVEMRGKQSGAEVPKEISNAAHDTIKTVLDFLYTELGRQRGFGGLSREGEENPVSVPVVAKDLANYVYANLEDQAIRKAQKSIADALEKELEPQVRSLVRVVFMRVTAESNP